MSDYTYKSRITGVVDLLRSMLVSTLTLREAICKHDETYEDPDDIPESVVASHVYCTKTIADPEMPVILIHPLDDPDISNVALGISKISGTVAVTLVMLIDGSEIEADGEIEDMDSISVDLTDFVGAMIEELTSTSFRGGYLAIRSISVAGLPWLGGRVKRVQGAAEGREMAVIGQDIQISYGIDGG